MIVFAVGQKGEPMRAIDADKMKADLLTVDPQFETMIDWCISVLDAQPTIEPEIIHCKDCSFSNGKPIADGRCWCNITHAYMHYCSDAERKDQHD